MCSTRPRPGGQASLETRFNPPRIDATVFLDPIEFIVAEHERQLAVCGVMDRLLLNPRHGADRAEIKAVRDYLQQDFPMHIADEEGDLFPLLQCRCPRGDNIQEVFDLLLREHETDRDLNRQVSDDLEVLIAGRAFTDPARFLMGLCVYSETQRRHLAWENAVVLPRARKHLTEEDCFKLGYNMAARRGLTLPS